MRHIVICGLSCYTIFFDIFSYTARFSKKCFWCALISSTNLSEIFLILGRIERDTTTNLPRYSRDVPVSHVI